MLFCHRWCRASRVHPACSGSVIGEPKRADTVCLILCAYWIAYLILKSVFLLRGLNNS